MTQLPSQPGETPAFRWPVRVYYEDTDAGGVVFFANYLKFFERARTEWLRACGFGQRELAESSQAVFVVRSLSADYRAPAKLDDQLEIVSRLVTVRRTSVVFEQEAWRGAQLLVSSSVRMACVDYILFRPKEIPVDVIEALQKPLLQDVSTGVPVQPLNAQPFKLEPSAQASNHPPFIANLNSE